MCYLISIEGLIGAGKSTLLNILVDYLQNKGLSTRVIPEPVELWKQSGMLQRFYHDPKRWAYHFQTMAFHDRIRITADALQQQQDAGGRCTDVIITERSIFSDTFFAAVLHEDGTLDDMEYAHYQRWWNMWKQLAPTQPQMFIYLRPSLQQCMHRIHDRGRVGEEHITSDYQQKLQAQHDRYFGVKKCGDDLSHHHSATANNVMVIETDDDFRTDAVLQNRLCSDILRWITSSSS